MSQREESTNDRIEPSRPGGKKAYLKPAFRHERVFETMALACGKLTPTQATCRSNRRNS